MIKPELLCRKHLLGCHVECHMLVGCIQKGKNIDGFMKLGLIEPQNVVEYHDKLAQEITNRGYTHKSPLPEVEHSYHSVVCQHKSLHDLCKRCEECKKRIKN